MKIAASVLVAALLISTVSAQTRKAEPRRVQATGAPLIALIESGEDALIVETLNSPPVEVTYPAGMPKAERSSQKAHIIAVVYVDEVDSQVTEKEESSRESSRD